MDSHYACRLKNLSGTQAAFVPQFVGLFLLAARGRQTIISIVRKFGFGINWIGWRWCKEEKDSCKKEEGVRVEQEKGTKWLSVGIHMDKIKSKCPLRQFQRGHTAWGKSCCIRTTNCVSHIPATVQPHTCVCNLQQWSHTVCNCYHFINPGLVDQWMSRRSNPGCHITSLAS